jgi:hypothetical protein
LREETAKNAKNANHNLLSGEVSGFFAYFAYFAVQEIALAAHGQGKGNGLTRFDSV